VTGSRVLVLCREGKSPLGVEASGELRDAVWEVVPWSEFGGSTVNWGAKIGRLFALTDQRHGLLL